MTFRKGTVYKMLTLYTVRLLDPSIRTYRLSKCSERKQNKCQITGDITKVFHFGHEILKRSGFTSRLFVTY